MGKIEKYYCDRCKKEIEKIDITLLYYYDKWCIGYDEEGKPIYNSEQREVMLCPDCADKLINFKEVYCFIPHKIRPV